MQRRLVALLVGVGLSLASPARPTITTAPDVGLGRRQEDEGPGFFGYGQVGSSWSAETCGQGMFFVSSSSYAACLPATARTVTNNIPKTCLRGSVIDYPSGPATCSGETSACMSILIHSDLGDESPTSMIFCHTATSEHSVYVKTTGSLPSSRTGASSDNKLTSSSMSSELAPTTDSATESTTRTTAAETEGTAPPPSSTNRPGESDSPRNMAWVAGPVVGGIAGVVIIGLLLWIIRLLRRRQKDTTHEGASTTGLYHSDQPKIVESIELKHSYNPAEMSSYKEPAELATYREPAEMYDPPVHLELETPKQRQELQG